MGNTRIVHFVLHLHVAYDFTQSCSQDNSRVGDFIYLLPDEIRAGLAGATMDTEEITQRQERYALITEGETTTLYTGKDVDQFLDKKQVKEVKTLRGLAANKGLVTGTVVLVKDRSELNKVKKGDILVTKLTTPDFVVAMERSGAIVTDIGGMGSHAAIIAREFGIPCIIGTEVATKVLKEDDYVEVDANNGFIRKII